MFSGVVFMWVIIIIIRTLPCPRPDRRRLWSRNSYRDKNGKISSKANRRVRDALQRAPGLFLPRQWPRWISVLRAWVKMATDNLVSIGMHILTLRTKTTIPPTTTIASHLACHVLQKPTEVYAGQGPTYSNNREPNFLQDCVEFGKMSVELCSCP